MPMTVPRPCRRLLLAACALALATPTRARVDLVTLPDRDQVQLTIYNSADLTLVRDQRALTLRQGDNRLQFAWADTLIDPTSLELVPGDAGTVTVQDLVYPPRTRHLGLWNVTAADAGAAPVEIRYFTSGVRWQAYYLATLTPDEGTMQLTGYVRVDNHSGEDYGGAETRLVVGKINLLDRVAELARRQWPHGRPGTQPVEEGQFAGRARGAPPAAMLDAAKAVMTEAAPKEIRKEGLSEYFLYTIEGTEDLPHGWGKRLLSFSADTVPVRNLYRYAEERYGSQVVRFLSFANDAAHGLGVEPIPGGLVKVYRRVDDAGHLSYVGARDTRYLPKGEDAHLELGPTRQVSVTPTRMEIATDNFEWQTPGHGRADTITGWDETRVVKVEVANTRDLPVQVEVRRNFSTASWDLETDGDPGAYTRQDKDTAQFTLDLEPGERREFRYTVVLRHGTRAL
jgi:hypothetical protein